MCNPGGWEGMPNRPSCDLKASLPVSLPPHEGEGQGPWGEEGDSPPTRDSSRSSRRYLLSMAWVRFSSCVETVSNSSSTAEEEQRSRGTDVEGGLPEQGAPHPRQGQGGAVPETSPRW